jgi:hypothetical protein
MYTYYNTIMHAYASCIIMCAYVSCIRMHASVLVIVTV